MITLTKQLNTLKMEQKNIKDYLHLYLGCKIMRFNKYLKPIEGTLYGITEKYILVTHGMCIVRVGLDEDFKIILRSMLDMSEVEKNEASDFVVETENFKYYSTGFPHYAKCTHYLLSKGFDLFGLIPAGLAIDATTLQ
jgi:hypothetical protein